jgi:N-acetylglucosaminyldiphosphoundecaprenol N-acetyl-beta-D-mannosaminyltransferase
VSKQINFLDYYLDASPLSMAINGEKKITINTINQYSFCMAEEDPLFRKSLLASDVLLADGEGIVLACQYLTGQRIEKVAGAQMHDHLLHCLNNDHGKCIYIGSTEATLDNISRRLKKEYPNITAEFYSPPFKSWFNESDIENIVNVVNKLEPSVVFIGLTAPKQEKLAHRLKEHIDANIICSIGAVFDFFAGTIQRPSQFWIDLKLEWFIRLVKEPRRMWKRYIYYGFIFLFLIIKEKSKLKSRSYQPVPSILKNEVV